MNKQQNRGKRQLQRSRFMAGLLPALGALIVITFPACKAFKVDIGTSEPIALDPIKFDPIEIEMTVNIESPPITEPKPKTDQTVNGAIERQNTRTGERKDILNNRWVGENHRGLLEVRYLPPDIKIASWILKIVNDENADREFLMEKESEEFGEDIKEIRKREWKNRQKSVWIGVLIEKLGDDGKYFWAQRLEPGGELVDESLWPPNKSDNKLPEPTKKEDSPQ